MAKHQMNTRVDEALFNAAANKAAARDETMTDVITSALTEYVKGTWAPAPPAMSIVPDMTGAPDLDMRCKHPGTRVIGGWCPTCEHQIQPGGKWA